MSEHLAAVDAAIATLSSVTRTLDQQIRAKEAEIRDLREDIADRDQTIAELNRRLAERAPAEPARPDPVPPSPVERAAGMKEAAFSVVRDGKVLTNPVLRSGYALLVVNEGDIPGIRVLNPKLWGPHQYGIYLGEDKHGAAGNDILIDGLTNIEGDTAHQGWPGVRVEAGLRLAGWSGAIRNARLHYAMHGGKIASTLRIMHTHADGTPLLVEDCDLVGDPLAIGPLDNDKAGYTDRSLAQRANVIVRRTRQSGRGVYLAAGATVEFVECDFNVSRGRAIEGKFLWGWPSKSIAAKKTGGKRRPAVVARFVRCRWAIGAIAGAGDIPLAEAVRMLWGAEPLPPSITFEDCSINGRWITGLPK